MYIFLETKAEWSSQRSDLLQMLAYRAQYDLGRHQGLKLFGENYLEIQYEHLLLKPQEELRKISQWLNIPFSENMLQFSKSARQLVASDEMSWKKEVLGPLLKNNMNKWEQELNPQKISQIESACNPAFQDGLYTKAYPNKTLQMNVYDSGMAHFECFIQK